MDNYLCNHNFHQECSISGILIFVITTIIKGSYLSLIRQINYDDREFEKKYSLFNLFGNIFVRAAYKFSALKI